MIGAEYGDREQQRGRSNDAGHRQRKPRDGEKPSRESGESKAFEARKERKRFENRGDGLARDDMGRPKKRRFRPKGAHKGVGAHKGAVRAAR